MRWIKDWIQSVIVIGLQVGAWCGLCGAWMERELTYRDWPISICAKCHAEYGNEKEA